MSLRSRLALAAILLLALGLRLYRLDYKSLWLDEACTWEYVKRPFEWCVKAEVTNPPGSFAIFWAAFRVFGDSERGLRFPSALAGVLAVWLLFRLARRLTDDPTALLAAFLYAASGFSLRYAQEARTFSFLACAVLASVEATVMLLERPTLGRAAYYVLASAAGLHFHYVFGFVVIAHNALVAWTWWVRGGKELRFLAWAAVQGVTGLLFLPWFVYMVGRVGPVHTDYITYPWGRVLALGFIFTWAYSRLYLSSGRDIARLLVDNWDLICIFFAVTVPLVVRGGIAAARMARAGAVIATTMAVPVALALALASAGSVRFTNERYLGFLCPFWTLLVAIGLRSIEGRRVRLAAFAMVLATVGMSLQYYYGITEISSENWRDAAHRVSSRRRPGDLVAICMPYMRCVYEYYDRAPKDLIELPHPTQRTAASDAEFDKSLEGRTRVWLVLGHVGSGADEAAWGRRLAELGFTCVGEPAHFPSPFGNPLVAEYVRGQGH